MTAALAAGCAVLGALVGTFGAVVVGSVSEEEPLFVQLRRRVGAGGARTLVSLRSPLLMAATAAVFAAMALRFGVDAALPAYLVLAAGLVPIAVIDAQQYLVPNHILYPTLFTMAPLLAVAAAVDGRWDDLRQAALGGVLAFLAMLVIHLINPAGLGFGDVRLAGLLGAALGWISLGHVLVGMFAGYLGAAVVGVALIALGRKSLKGNLPLGPFLVLGALVIILAGDPLVEAYLG